MYILCSILSSLAVTKVTVTLAVAIKLPAHYLSAKIDSHTVHISLRITKYVNCDSKTFYVSLVTYCVKMALPPNRRTILSPAKHSPGL